MPIFVRFFHHHPLFAWGATVWSVAVAGGFALLTAYSARQGESRSASDRWPEDSAVSRAEERSTLLVFAHPRCPCTRATLEELAGLLEKSPTRPAVNVYFFQPRNASEDWGAQSPLWKLAASIPGVTVHADPEGSEARRFGAMTSGQALLFAADGQLLFRGGITLGRGERGTNPGGDRLLAQLNGGENGAAAAPIFGCPIFASGGLSR